MLSYKGYIGVVEFDEEAETFFGKVVNTRDTITFESTDARKLRAEFEISVDVYLEFCAKKGRTPEKGYSGRITVRIPPEEHARLASKAAQAGVSLNEFIATRITTAA